MAKTKKVDSVEKKSSKKLGVIGVELGQGQDIPNNDIFTDNIEPDLSGSNGLRQFQKMESDSYISGAYLGIRRLLQTCDFIPTQNESNTPLAESNMEFLKEVMNDMNRPFEDFVFEALTMIKYGFSYFEQVYKVRNGSNPKSKSHNSKYNDGKFGWRKIASRSPITILDGGWDLDENGGVQGAWQEVDYKKTYLPIEKCLLFTLEGEFGNPQGRSMFYSAHQPWKKKKLIDFLESVGIERDLAGLAQFEVPESWFDAEDEDSKNKLADLQKSVSNIRRNKLEGLVTPMMYDSETGNKLFEFKLVTGGGARQFDIDKIIERLNHEMTAGMLADFMTINSGGSMALHEDKTKMFKDVIEAISNVVRDVLNTIAIPRLFNLNGITEDLPKFEVESVKDEDLTTYIENLGKLQAMGMSIFPDENIEDDIRGKMKMPEPTDKSKM